MNYGNRFIVEPGAKLRLDRIDPSFTGKHVSHSDARGEIAHYVERLDALQYLLYADHQQSLLIVLQALDAGGKDGVIRHLFSGMNPQGTSVFCFKQPSRVELDHDFLQRAHLHAPGKGEVVIFNRSHYEDVLVVRVHKLVTRSVWSKRYELINDFEKMLAQNGTRILKFYLHISPEEQLERFRQRLDDKAKRWKISENDYLEREFWPRYTEAYQETLMRTSTRHAPWYVIPANHKWFRDLAVSQIITRAIDDLGLALPPTQVKITDILRRYHAAKATEVKANTRAEKRAPDVAAVAIRPGGARDVPA